MIIGWLAASGCYDYIRRMRRRRRRREWIQEDDMCVRELILVLRHSAKNALQCIASAGKEETSEEEGNKFAKKGNQFFI